MTPYTPFDWNDGPEGNTPITAARLDHLETQHGQIVADLSVPTSAVAVAVSGIARGIVDAVLGLDPAADETMPRVLGTATGNTGTGRLYVFPFTARATAARSKATMIVGTGAAATPTLCKMGVYEVNADGTHTLVAQTANVPTMFSTGNGFANGTFTAPANLVAGKLYAACFLVVSAATMPTFSAAGPIAAVSTTAGAAPAVGYYYLQSDLTATLPVPVVASQGSQRFYMKLSA